MTGPCLKLSFDIELLMLMCDWLEIEYRYMLCNKIGTLMNIYLYISYFIRTHYYVSNVCLSYGVKIIVRQIYPVISAFESDVRVSAFVSECCLVYIFFSICKKICFNEVILRGFWKLPDSSTLQFVKSLKVLSTRIFNMYFTSLGK